MNIQELKDLFNELKLTTSIINVCDYDNKAYYYTLKDIVKKWNSNDYIFNFNYEEVVYNLNAYDTLVQEEPFLRIKKKLKKTHITIDNIWKSSKIYSVGGEKNESR